VTTALLVVLVPGVIVVAVTIGWMRRRDPGEGPAR
jgi:hypothetical protein